jgi:3,4-dihydroxy 2-butanone 4-phosphate synthase/GTP cyclohydrolase II
MKNESLIREIGYAPSTFLGTNVRRVDFLDHFENHQIAYVFGDIKSKMAVKFHNVSSDFNLLSSDKRYFSLINSIEKLKEEGGVLIFISYEQKTPEQIKDYGIGAQILRKLGVKDIKLLTSKKGKEFVGIRGFGLDVVDEIEI